MHSNIFFYTAQDNIFTIKSFNVELCCWSVLALRLNPGATEHLDNLSFTYQTKKRKTFSPPARKPSETTFPRKTNYSLLHRQLGSSSSFGSLGTQALTTSQTAPSKKSDFAEAETLAPADKCVANDSTCTPDQALPTHHRENSTISSASEVQKHPKSGNQVRINRNVSVTKDTLKSSSGSLKGEKFTDLSTPGISTIQISDVVSESNCTVSSQPQSNRPSTPYVCKSNKKLTRCPRSSAPTKQQLQSENLNGPEKNWEFQTDKSDMMSEISLCASRVARSSDSDSHETKQGFRQISRTASDSPLQKEMRSEASPQVLFKTPTPIRSAKPPACKRTQRTFKCQESSASLDNLRPPTQTPFQKPDTPRPKSCPESLKWKKALEQRFTNRKHGGVGISDDQRWNRSSQLFSLHGHGNKSDSKRGNIDRQESAPSIQSPVDWIRQEKPNISHAHATPDQPSSTSSPELTQAIFSAMSFFMGIPHVESEVSSISINCYPSPNSDSSPFGLQTSQISRQRANISGYQHHGDVLEPVGTIQESKTQLYFARTS